MERPSREGLIASCWTASKKTKPNHNMDHLLEFLGCSHIIHYWLMVMSFCGRHGLMSRLDRLLLHLSRSGGLWPWKCSSYLALRCSEALHFLSWIMTNHTQDHATHAGCCCQSNHKKKQWAFIHPLKQLYKQNTKHGNARYMINEMKCQQSMDSSYV